MTGEELQKDALRRRDDIVKRLRDYDNCHDGDVDEAADEIERLRKRVGELVEEHQEFESFHDEMKEGVAVRIADLEQELAAMKKQWNDLDNRTERHHLEWTLKWLNIQGKIRYWSYCTWMGMRKECPENSNELREWFRELNIDPYATELAEKPEASK